ncbi:MAG: LacI family DNA-binding transcriptional regulator [Chloroflexi bacterium]|nr:LacI family DNA-binding transcriptional regulator [Chloroflexota bacterium]
MTTDFDNGFNDLSLEDIARLSGVSRSTVSRVVNQHPNVSDTTRRKVMEIITRYNFKPHPAARALASQRSKIIGILIPHIVSDLFTDPFFSILLQGITTAANSLNYSPILWLTSANVDESAFYDQVFNDRLADGMIVASATVNATFLERLDQRSKPYIIIGRPFTAHEKTSYVDSENEQGARMLVEHLILSGRRRIGMITGRSGLTSSHDRLQGYISALQHADIPIDMRLITPASDYTDASGYSGMKLLLQHRVDAVFAANDVMAVSAMRAIKEAGLRIPEDIAIGGFDDMGLAHSSEPPLTTIHQPISHLGDSAVRGLIDLLEGKVEPPFQQMLPVKLIVRQST